jgi:hypothetical protein
MSAILRSDGQREARAYTLATVPAPRPEPPLQGERVAVCDPRDSCTAPSSARAAGTGPRNADQAVWPPPGPPALDLPDALPATKAQRVYIDPALAAQWREEARRKGSA